MHACSARSFLSEKEKMEASLGAGETELAHIRAQLASLTGGQAARKRRLDARRRVLEKEFKGTEDV